MPSMFSVEVCVSLSMVRAGFSRTFLPIDQPTWCHIQPDNNLNSEHYTYEAEIMSHKLCCKVGGSHSNIAEQYSRCATGISVVGAGREAILHIIHVWS